MVLVRSRIAAVRWMPMQLRTMLMCACMCTCIHMVSIYLGLY